LTEDCHSNTRDHSLAFCFSLLRNNRVTHAAIFSGSSFLRPARFSTSLSSKPFLYSDCSVLNEAQPSVVQDPCFRSEAWLHDAGTWHRLVVIRKSHRSCRLVKVQVRRGGGSGVFASSGFQALLFPSTFQSIIIVFLLRRSQSLASCNVYLSSAPYYLNRTTQDRYSTARVSKRLTDGTAACLRARYCTGVPMLRGPIWIRRLQYRQAFARLSRRRTCATFAPSQ